MLKNLSKQYFELFDPKKVKLLTALIYLNICGLHDYPYAKFYIYMDSIY